MDIKPAGSWETKFRSMLHEAAHAKYHLKEAAKFDWLERPSGSFERSEESWRKYEIDPEEIEADNQEEEWAALADELVENIETGDTERDQIFCKCVALKLYYELKRKHYEHDET